MLNILLRKVVSVLLQKLDIINIYLIFFTSAVMKLLFVS